MRKKIMAMKDFQFNHLGKTVFVKFISEEEMIKRAGFCTTGTCQVEMKKGIRYGVMRINKATLELGKTELIKTFFHELMHVTIQFKDIKNAFDYPHELEESMIFAAEDCLDLIME